MKNLEPIICLVLFNLTFCEHLSAQESLKIGYVDQNYIYSNLPEYKVFNNEIEVNAANYQNILKEKYSLYQQKIDVYQSDIKNKAASEVLKDKESELQNLQSLFKIFKQILRLT